MTEAGQNAAWVRIDTPLPADRLYRFASDLERLWRLNPHLEIHACQGPAAPPAPGQVWHLDWSNETNGLRRQDEIRVVETVPGQRYELNYAAGVKQSTTVSVETGEAGATLVITERYDPAAGDERAAEVDRSITAWGVAIRRHLLGMRRWGGFAPYRWLRERFWLRMPPRSRRISRLIVWVTILEFVVFLFVFAIYWIELRR